MGRISAQLERMERYITTSAETGEGQQATEKGQKSETDVQDQERFGGFGEAIRAAADGWLNDYGYLKESLKPLQILVDALPDNKKDVAKVRIYSDQLASEESTEREITSYKEGVSLFYERLFGWVEFDREEKCLRKIEEARNDMDNLQMYRMALYEQILEDFERESRHAKRRLYRFTIMSYVLYPLGILIGLFGQMIGVKPATGE
jgi:hypothetical protein